ncbi:hypothetical protein [Vreelandella sp. EE27]
MKSRGFDQEEVSFDTPMVWVALYVLLVLGGGLLYSFDNQAMYIYPVLLAAVGTSLAGLYTLSRNLEPGQSKGGALTGMIMMGVGMLVTAPASLLNLPMIKTLQRQKLRHYLASANTTAFAEF